MTNEEVEQVQNTIPLHTFTGVRLRVLVEVLLATGRRISEASALDRTPFELGQTEVEIIGKGGKQRRAIFNRGVTGMGQGVALLQKRFVSRSVDYHRNTPVARTGVTSPSSSSTARWYSLLLQELNVRPSVRL